MREFDRVLSDLERSPRKVLLTAPIRDVAARLPRAQRDRVVGALDADAPIGSLRGSGPFDALIVRDQMAMLKALERWVREAATATGELRAGLPRDELVRWASEAGVRELLDLPVRMLVDPRGAWTYGDRSVLAALSEAPSAGARETVLERVQGALCDRLKAAAAAVEQGRAEERTLPTQAPGDARLASLWMSLVALRAGVRADVEPSGGVDAEPRLDPAKGGLVVTTWRTCPRTGALAGSVALGLRGAPALSCGCGRRDARCGLGLAVVDQALRGLHGALGPKVADWLAEPMWVDRLRRLDAVLAPRGNTVALGWRIDLQREVTVRPVTITAQGLVPASRGAVEAHDDFDRELLVLTARDDGDAVFTALRRLAGHPRAYVDGALADVVVGTIGLRLVPTMFGARLVVVIDGALAGASDLDGAVRVGQHGLLLRRGQRLVVYAAGAALRALVADLRDAGDTFRSDALPALMERWPQLSRVAPAEVDPGLIGGSIELLAEPIVVLAVRGQGLAVDVRMRVGGSSFAPGEGDDVAWQVVDGKLVQARRDLAGERALAQGLCERLGLLAPSAVIADPGAAWSLLDQLRDGVTVVWAGTRRRALAAPRVADLRLHVGTGDRWLAVGGEVDLDGRAVSLAELVAALRERRGTVVVGDDLVRLAGPLVEHLRALDAIATTGADGRWLLPEAAAPVLGELAKDAVIDGDAPFQLAFDRWRSTFASSPELPDGFSAELRDYQLAGFRFLARLAAWTSGALLCDDMGLGKTVQALALLASRASLGPQLVVAPTSVMSNWVREAARFAPGLRVGVHHGASRDLGAPGPGSVLVTSWDLLVRDEEVLRSVQFATVVFDEAQATKNATTRRAKSARALSSAFRVVLTGTPLENRLSELWSLVDLAVPGLLGDSRSFRDRFAVPIERNADEDARIALGRLLAPFLLRRTKGAVATELPPRTEVIVPIDLDAAGRSVYDVWRTAALRDLGRRDLPAQNQRVLVLAALTALRQAACSAHLVDKSLPRTSAKLERLRELVTELREEGHQALVFSQFVSLLGIVREMLAADGVKLRYLDGSTPAAVRQEEVDRFQAGDGEVFLISLKAGGTGLNLTAATYVIHLDPWWNPAVEDQASDRAHRIGQDRPVTVYKLVARGTVEEAIVALQGEKRALVDGVLGDAGKAAALPLDELVALLSYGVSP